MRKELPCGNRKEKPMHNNITMNTQQNDNCFDSYAHNKIEKESKNKKIDRCIEYARSEKTTKKN